MTIITPLEIVFDITEGLDYLKSLDKFFHLRWSFNDLRESERYQSDRQHNSPNHNVTPLYYWTLRSNQYDNWRPERLDYYFEDCGTEYKNTELVFGFAEKLLRLFPDMCSMHIGGHPPGAKLELHQDDEEYFRIHVPLVTNNQAYFFGEDGVKYYLMPGRLYILETKKYHGTANNGDSDRIHLLFKMPRHLLDDVIKLTGRI
jgi:hypothetical protein